MPNSGRETLIEGQQYTFCLLRLDGAGSTRISKMSSTQDSQETLDNLFKLINKHILENDGEEWDRSGDGALFCFYDENSSISCKNAVNSAINIVESLDAFNKIDNVLDYPFQLRLALHLHFIRYREDTGTISS